MSYDSFFLLFILHPKKTYFEVLRSTYYQGDFRYLKGCIQTRLGATGACDLALALVFVFARPRIVTIDEIGDCGYIQVLRRTLCL